MSEKIYTIDEIKKLVNETLKKFEVKKAILFGSYAKNTSTAKNDIDIVIESEGKLLNINFYGVLKELVEKLQKNIDLFEILEIQKDSKIYKNIKKEGVVIMRSKNRIIIQKIIGYIEEYPNTDAQCAPLHQNNNHSQHSKNSQEKITKTP